MNSEKSVSFSIAGKEIKLSTGKIARQANGAVVLTCGDTTILSTACQSKEPLEGVNFLPLRVDYQEKFSSAGKTLGGFIKREGKPTEKEVLTCRLIDRPIRPLFEDGFFYEVQLLSFVLSYDPMAPPQPLAITAVSASLAVSDISFKKPVAGVSVAYINDEFIVNPTLEQTKESKLELLMAGTSEAILMIEGYADFLPEETLLQGIEKGHEAIKEICAQILKLQSIAGKTKKIPKLKTINASLVEAILKKHEGCFHYAFTIDGKEEKEAGIAQVVDLIKEGFSDEENGDISPAIKEAKSRALRSLLMEKNKRADGRNHKEIRPISIESGILPRTHGSALFTRGETQAIAVCTLGGDIMGQRFEDLEGDKTSSFYLQYSFPPYSVGEVGRMGPPGRREVGHGKLAEKSLLSIKPAKESFPYTIRLESNITESNGSSSMASVCGGCLAMMDAGIPITRPIAGIAMGLVLENDSHVVLSDILGIEDALGDMDFKITGDDNGVTAFQLDIKVEGITIEIMRDALEQAKEGRTHILKEMLKALPESRTSLSSYAPRIETIMIKPSKVAIVIGPSGKTIKSIIADTGVNIDINDEGPEATVKIASSNPEALEIAKQRVLDLIADVEIGAIYKGKIVSIVDFGAFVQILNKEGLLHISEIDTKRVEKVSDYYKEGDEVEVKVLDVTDQGKIRLSRKALLTKESSPKEDEKLNEKDNKKSFSILPPPSK